METKKIKKLEKEPKKYKDGGKMHTVIRFYRDDKYIYGKLYKEEYAIKQAIGLDSDRIAKEVLASFLMTDLADQDRTCYEPLVIDENGKEIKVFDDSKKPLFKIL